MRVLLLAYAAAASSDPRAADVRRAQTAVAEDDIQCALQPAWRCSYLGQVDKRWKR